MEPVATPVASPKFGPEAIAAELEKVLASRTFRNASRPSGFLRYVVEQSLQGHGNQVKEYSVGIEVFGRSPSFDPRLDSVVRVEATKLRSKLATYYETEGAKDPIRIDFPKGAYLPNFHTIPTPVDRHAESSKEDSTPVPLRSNTVAWFLAAAFAFAAALLALKGRASPKTFEPVRFEFALQSRVSFNSETGNLAMSPDGSRIALTAIGADGVSRIYLRSLDSLDLRALAGTEGTGGVPFWSNDGRNLIFGSSGKLKKIDVSGGPPQTLCDLGGMLGGGYWTDDHRVVFGVGAGVIYSMPEAGGKPSPITILDKSRQENFHVHPFPLPDGKHFLYVRSSRADSGGVYVGSILAKPENQDTNRLLSDQTSTVYMPSDSGSGGYLLFVRDGTLMAQPFDPSTLKLSDKPIPVAENVANFGRTGAFALSPNGALAYRTGSSAVPQLAWFDRRGRTLGTAGGHLRHIAVALSPGDRYVVSAIQADATNVSIVDLWLFDLDHESSTRITLDPALHNFPVWSPDGSRIAFASNRFGTADLYMQASNGSVAAELLLRSNRVKLPTDWSRDGRYLLYSEIDPQTKSDLWILPLTGDRKPVQFLQTDFDEGQGQFSPNSKWLAYSSDETGRREIYVQPFPKTTARTGRWLISSGGGAQPRWRSDGRELFYVAGDQTVMVSEVTTDSGFSAGVAKPLFDAPFARAFSDGSWSVFRWDVAADGQRFLISTQPKEATGNSVNVVMNWQATLKRP